MTTKWLSRWPKRRKLSSRTVFFLCFMAFLAWLSPFAPLNVLCVAAIVSVADAARLSLLGRVWLLRKLVQLCFVALSVLFAAIAIGTSSKEALTVLTLLLITGTFSITGLVCFFVYPLSQESRLEINRDHEPWKLGRHYPDECTVSLDNPIQAQTYHDLYG